MLGSLCAICCDFVGDGIYVWMLCQETEKKDHILKALCTCDLECLFCQSLNCVLPVAKFNWCCTVQTIIDIRSYWRYSHSAYVLFRACQAWLKWHPCFCWLSFLFVAYFVLIGVHGSFFFFKKQSISSTSCLPHPTKDLSEKDSCSTTCIHPKECQCCVAHWWWCYLLAGTRKGRRTQVSTDWGFHCCMLYWRSWSFWQAKEASSRWYLVENKHSMATTHVQY